MLLTLGTFFTLSRRFDTRLVGFGFEALNGFSIAGETIVIVTGKQVEKS